jgi:hypothetical protein
MARLRYACVLSANVSGWPVQPEILEAAEIDARLERVANGVRRDAVK